MRRRKAPRAEFFCDDAFSFVPTARCDAAFNWYSSFGYADDARNLEMLRRAFESLVPGGRFALDVPNMPGLFRGFQSALVRRGETSRGEVVLTRESQLDLAAGVLAQQWTYLLADGQKIVRHSRLRIYLPHQLSEMLAGCGFEQIELLGSTNGEPLCLDSPRCIVICRRPG